MVAAYGLWSSAVCAKVHYLYAQHEIIAQLEVSQGKVIQAAVPQRPVRDTLVEV
jgi:hypothetical protein